MTPHQDSSQWERRSCRFNPTVALLLMFAGREILWKLTWSALTLCMSLCCSVLFYFHLFWGDQEGCIQAGAGLTRKWYLKSRNRLWQDHRIYPSHVPLLHINDAAYLPPQMAPSYRLYLCQSEHFKFVLYIGNNFYKARHSRYVLWHQLRVNPFESPDNDSVSFLFKKVLD